MLPGRAGCSELFSLAMLDHGTLPALAVACAMTASLAGAASAEETEHEELENLRNSWLLAKDQGERPLREKYHQALIDLQKRLTRAQEFKEALHVRDEIELLTRGVHPAKKEADAGPVPPALVRLQETFDREMARMSAPLDTKYFAALKGLRNRSARAEKLSLASAAKNELARYRPPDRERNATWAAIEVRCSTSRVAVKELTRGRARLSGRYRPGFSKFDSRLAGTRFLRVPWNESHTMRVTVTGTGYLLVYSCANLDLDKTRLMWRRAESLLEGPYLSHVYKAHVVRGDQFEIRGAEVAFLAKEIAASKSE